ncbi:MAG TPA: hypothetical protein VGP63_26240 [Planctomycetaceae bacterium]|jgi:hypothetical protein|nr:hypothetical protein [Planctomycetaceae bacterium]
MSSSRHDHSGIRPAPDFAVAPGRGKRHLLKYERKNQPLISRRAFARRLATNAAFSVGLILVSLFAGMLGYHFFEAQSWVDAFANAAMILSGMGPLGQLNTTGGKIFAGLYALYSGLALILAIGVVIAPIVHRFLHRFHMEAES